MIETLKEQPLATTKRGAPPSFGLMYFTPRDVLVPRVDRQCIMRFCEAMAARGLEVEVVSLDVRLDYEEPTRSRDLFDVYGLRTRFTVAVLPNWTRQSGAERINPLLRLVAYSAYVSRKLLARKSALSSDHTILYFKNYLLGLPFLLVRKLLGRRIVLLFEIHVPPTRRLSRALLRHMDGVIPVSRILARELEEELGIEPTRILVAHQGVNLQAVEEVRQGKEEARIRLGLSSDKRLAVYTGKVHDWSGEIELLLRCAARLPADVEMVIVGGREDHVARLRERARREGIHNVRFTGFVAPADVFHYQMAADVLVTYYPSDLPINKYRASPGKLFEYMASGRPIVTADYPALREVLSPGAALFVDKDDPRKLAEGVERILADDALGERLARQAYQDVQEYTWEKRAERVHDFALALSGLKFAAEAE